MIGFYAYSPDVWPAIVTFALTIFLAQYSWRRRHIAGARAYAFACALSTLWVLGVILEILAVDVPVQVFWRRFQAVWMQPVGVGMSCFIIQFAGLGRWLTRRTCALLFLVPLLNAIAIVTNGYHHLVWAGFVMERQLVPLPGPLFWLLNGYILALGVLNLGILGWLAFRSPRHRWPVAIILFGQIVGRVGFVLGRFGTDGVGPGELVLFTVGLAGAAYAVAFLGFHFIDPVTAARTAVLRQMGEGMVVLDLEGRFVDVNPMGASILGIPETRLRDRFVSEFPLLAAAISQYPGATGTTRTEIVLGQPGPARYYDMQATPLKGRGGELIGQLLLLHDLTEQRRAQAGLLEQQEVVATLRERERIARELHDGIGQVLGYVAIQAQTALRWMRGGDGDRAGATLERLAEVAQDAHVDVRESIFCLKNDAGQEWSFLQNLGRYLQKFQANYGIRTEHSIADGIGEDTFEPAVGVQLLRVVQEALSNSRRHGGAGCVHIRIEGTGGHARITVADDGRGFDAGQGDGGREGHFGLTFMRERMQQIGGAIRIDSTPGAGTILTLDVPIREQGGSFGESASG